MQRTAARIPPSAILDLGDYERKRDEIRPRAIAARGIRRIELGPNATLAFENRETVVYQIQEMLRAERIVREAEIAHEIETYSDLLPTADGLSATLMFEFGDEATRAVRLHDLVGFEEHLHLDFGSAGRSKAEFDERQLDSEKISAVQFVRFKLSAGQISALSSAGEVQLAADHPAYTWSVRLTAGTRAALAADLLEARKVG